MLYFRMDKHQSMLNVANKVKQEDEKITFSYKFEGM
jgi:hypothetical protein